VRVIADDGEQLGVLPTYKALQLAKSKDLDLVEVSPTTQPPVARLMDYGRYKYEQTRKEREQRKTTRPSLLKEMRLGSVKIDDHDLETKTRIIQKFLKAGDKVRVSLRFRGREMTHPELGRQLFDKVAELVAGEGLVEKTPSMENRQMSIILAPLSAAARAKLERDAAVREQDQEAPALQPQPEEAAASSNA
jgi:translation initiation factor IF-3